MILNEVQHVPPIRRTVKIISVSIAPSLFPELLTLALFTDISFYSVLSYANVTVMIHVNCGLRKTCLVHCSKRSSPLSLATTTPHLSPQTTKQKSNQGNCCSLFQLTHYIAEGKFYYLQSGITS